MSIERTPIQKLELFNNNVIYIKRDDLIPFSFGGNKARKAELFFADLEKQNCDCVVTYGSSSSNHCRVISNLCARRKIPCYIISPAESSGTTFNSILMRLFAANIQVVPVDKVHDTIEKCILKLKDDGLKPYFIPGGGHGNIGTQAYVNCYNEIRDWEKENELYFDYIFHASGTGTTQAGLVCGQLLNKDSRKIVGISIARPNPRGRQVVVESINEYLKSAGFYCNGSLVDDNTLFIDSYIGSGYGANNSSDIIKMAMTQFGIPMDSTYTAKAYMGMHDYLIKEKIEDRNILFIHTGGTPLFFDDLKIFEF